MTDGERDALILEGVPAEDRDARHREHCPLCCEDEERSPLSAEHFVNTLYLIHAPHLAWRQGPLRPRDHRITPHALLTGAYRQAVEEQG